MPSAIRVASGWMFFAIAFFLIGCLSGFPTPAEAQQGGQGQNAVYPASEICCVGSTAFIDASMFATSPPPPSRNICGVLNFVLNPSNHFIPAAGAVIDARGLPGTTRTSMTCTASPWAGITNPPPSTILLPATGAHPIIIPGTWRLPPNTHLIGEGDGIPSASFAPGTTIQASISFLAVPGEMISFGISSLCASTCTGISVENLTLDGQSQSIDGIDNGLAQDLSYVNHVSLYQIRGTGLSVSGSANNSGPYSNITFDLGGSLGTTSTVCASINGLTSTRGIHGLTCVSPNNDPPAAVLLDSSNNSIEDVRIVGFYDGILVGANADAKSNVLIDIIGDTLPINVSMPINVVHIANVGHTVSDLSITGLGNMGGVGTYILQDDVTGPHLTDTSVGIYALGEQASGGHSRFTTSPNATTWAVGSNFPSGGCTAATRGSLYSCIGGSSACTSGSSTAALWTCALNGSAVQWVAVK